MKENKTLLFFLFFFFPILSLPLLGKSQAGRLIALVNKEQLDLSDLKEINRIAQYYFFQAGLEKMGEETPIFVSHKKRSNFGPRRPNPPDYPAKLVSYGHAHEETQSYSYHSPAHAQRAIRSIKAEIESRESTNWAAVSAGPFPNPIPTNYSVHRRLTVSFDPHQVACSFPEIRKLYTINGNLTRKNALDYAEGKAGKMDVSCVFQSGRLVRLTFY
ncbi:hypothetical protein EM20IM_08645 [Candidatus Methylacidiphilum infernorum]|uniref:Uncharacterized protein n=1 Tax=Candidatus Methylacidiphilum infernorum TaxID=511746 RepID=A0ABX7PUQ0_9BACT|nr:hypothetical protein [Candidatus Methylacidiphilum infernorum]QSR86545.1 hypothetical protein EM20IM_08645 [Candidatus Methylacidiphilum infernorum]